MPSNEGEVGEGASEHEGVGERSRSRRRGNPLLDLLVIHSVTAVEVDANKRRRESSVQAVTADRKEPLEVLEILVLVVLPRRCPPLRRLQTCVSRECILSHRTSCRKVQEREG